MEKTKILEKFHHKGVVFLIEKTLKILYFKMIFFGICEEGGEGGGGGRGCTNLVKLSQNNKSFAHFF